MVKNRVQIKYMNCFHRSSSHHGHPAAPARRHASALLGRGLGVLDGLVDREDDARGLRGRRDGVDLDQGWLQNAGAEVVGDPLGLDVDAKVGALAGLLGVLLAQLAQDVVGVETGVVTQGPAKGERVGLKKKGFCVKILKIFAVKSPNRSNLK